MIRGALEVADDKIVAGWLYSATIDLNGRLVQAFSAGRCIGTGKIELFRADLKAVGFGHGKYGFHFPIDTSGVEPGSTVVRLEGSDLSLLHGASKVVAGKLAPAGGR
jgi:hypothetical protein